ncbi:hypothetical protein PYCC9005_002547 [Savitreella phatthalungensis]
MMLSSLWVMATAGVCAGLGVSGTGTAVIGRIVESQLLPDVSGLPYDCRVRLSNGEHTYTAPVRADGGFSFGGVAKGSFLLQTQCGMYGVMPLRVDVGQTQSSADELAGAVDGAVGDVAVYRTLRGGEWSAVQGRLDHPITLEVHRTFDYYTPPPTFNPLGMLKNPMVLAGIFIVLSLFVMPKFVQWIDPEGVAEMNRIKDEKAKEAAVKARTQRQTNPSAEQLANFDVSGWLAGKK